MLSIALAWRLARRLRQSWIDDDPYAFCHQLGNQICKSFDAAGLAAFAPETAAIRAGRLMLEEITLCAARDDSFAFETTLAGVGWLNRIRQWRERGYRVSLYFLCLPNVEAAIERVAFRVRQGGHDIPETVIRRRFASGLANFQLHYKMAVSDWMLYDSSGSEPVLLEWSENP